MPIYPRRDKFKMSLDLKKDRTCQMICIAVFLVGGGYF